VVRERFIVVGASDHYGVQDALLHYFSTGSVDTIWSDVRSKETALARNPDLSLRIGSVRSRGIPGEELSAVANIVEAVCEQPSRR